MPSLIQIKKNKVFQNQNIRRESERKHNFSFHSMLKNCRPHFPCHLFRTIAAEWFLLPVLHEQPNAAGSACSFLVLPVRPRQLKDRDKKLSKLKSDKSFVLLLFREFVTFVVQISKTVVFTQVLINDIFVYLIVTWILKARRDSATYPQSIDGVLFWNYVL